MPKQRTVTIYQFEELPDDAKERARDWYRSFALDHDWWEYTFDDAERAGLKIEEFDIDHCSIHGTLTTDIHDSVKRIMADHGKECDTYKLASEYAATLAGMKEDDDDYEEELERITEEYEHALNEEYLSILRQEMDYQLSNECIDACLIANEYDFLETGERA